MAIKKVIAKKATVKKPLVKAQTGKQTPFQKGVSKGDFNASDTNYVTRYVKDVVSGANKLPPDAPKTTKGKKDYNKKLADAYKKTYGYTSPGTRAMEIRSTQGEYPYTEKEFRVKSQAGIPVIKQNESFNDAFKRARSQGYSTFQWNGKSYNTKLKGEKKTGGTTSSTKMQKGGQKSYYKEKNTIEPSSSVLSTKGITYNKTAIKNVGDKTIKVTTKTTPTFIGPYTTKKTTVVNNKPNKVQTKTYSKTYNPGGDSITGKNFTTKRSYNKVTKKK